MTKDEAIKCATKISDALDETMVARMSKEYSESRAEYIRMKLIYTIADALLATRM